MQGFHEVSRIPSQGISALEERPQLPPELQETRVIPFDPSRLRSPSASSTFSTATQNSAGQARLSGGGGPPSPIRTGSITPTLEKSYNTTTSPRRPPGRVVGHRKRYRVYSDADEEVNPDGNDRDGTSIVVQNLPPRGPRSEEAGPSRLGKERRLEPFSDEEAGAGESGLGDVPMEEDMNHPQHQRQHGEVSLISVPMALILISQKSRLATEDDILKLCQSFHLLTREFIKEVITELRKGSGQRNGRMDYAADDESDGDGPRRRFRKRKSRYPGVRRRPAAQNSLSVSFSIFPLLSLTLLSQSMIRAHMRGLIRKVDWLKDVISENELNNWNPKVRECCTAQEFKLHLKGTPSNPWNASATRVFADHFLDTYSQIYPDVWAVRRMVLKKTRAYVKSLIKAYRESRRSDNLQLATKEAKNRRERKTNVSPSKRFGGAILKTAHSCSIVVETSRSHTHRWRRNVGC
jgi:hypothetical protein